MKISKSYVKSTFFILLYILIGTNSNALASDFIKEDSLLMVLKYEKNRIRQSEIYLELIKHSRKYDLKKSLYYYEAGYKLANKKKDLLTIANLRLEAATTNYYLGNYDKALDQYLQALQQFELDNNLVGKIRTLNNIGTIHDRIEDFNKAIEYYQLSIQNFYAATENAQQENKKYIAHIYNNLASAYDKLDQTQLSIDYYEKSLKIAKEIGLRQIMGSIYNNLGKIETTKGNFTLSKQYLNNAIKIRTELNEKDGLAKSYYFLSDYYKKYDKPDSAEWAAIKSLKIAEEYNLLEAQKIAHMFLFEIYSKQGNIHKALSEHIKFKQISDSLLNKQKLSQLSQLQTNYEIEKVNSQNLIDKSRMKNKYTLWVIVLSSIASIAILLVYILKLEKKKVVAEKSKLELEVESKNKELTTNVMYLVQKNEFINTIAKSLSAILDNIKGDNKKDIQRIIYNLQSQSDNEIWKEFEFRFKQVHNNFYDQLREKHSDITPSEERLAALLRLNMTTKEIASITHQSIRGIEVARGRLRKKLNLTGMDTNLQAYLSNF